MPYLSVVCLCTIVCRRYHIINTFATMFAMHGQYMFGAQARSRCEFNDETTRGIVFGAINADCKETLVNGNNVDLATNTTDLGNAVSDKLSDLNDRNAKRTFH